MIGSAKCSSSVGNVTIYETQVVPNVIRPFVDYSANVFLDTEARGRRFQDVGKDMEGIFMDLFELIFLLLCLAEFVVFNPGNGIEKVLQVNRSTIEPQNVNVTFNNDSCHFVS